MKKDILYIVIPCYNEEEVIRETNRQVGQKLQALIDAGRISEKSRIVYVNDGSTDHTWALIGEINAAGDRVVGISLSKNCGHQYALMAGLMSSMNCCDVTISMDADLQDDLDAIDRMLDKYYDEKCEIVYGVRDDRTTDSFFKRSTAHGFYKLVNGLGGDVVYDHADFRLMNKRALQGLARFEEYHLFLRGVVPMIGFKTGQVHYHRKERLAGTSKYPIFKMVTFALEGITSLSNRPLNLISFLGFFVILISIGMLGYSVIQYFLGNTIRGWSSTMVSIWLLGGIQLLCIGVVGIYVGKIYIETKRRPRYIISEVLECKEES